MQEQETPHIKQTELFAGTIEEEEQGIKQEQSRIARVVRMQEHARAVSHNPETLLLMELRLSNSIAACKLHLDMLRIVRSEKNKRLDMLQKMHRQAI